jgi:hypothetical protein
MGFGHFLGLEQAASSMWLLYVFFTGFQSGLSKVAEGIVLLQMHI